MRKQRKMWVRPELTVLTRSKDRPTSVLQGCKDGYGGMAISALTNRANRCYKAVVCQSGYPTCCDPCYDGVTS